MKHDSSLSELKNYPCTRSPRYSTLLFDQTYEDDFHLKQRRGVQDIFLPVHDLEFHQLTSSSLAICIWLSVLTENLSRVCGRCFSFNWYSQSQLPSYRLMVDSSYFLFSLCLLPTAVFFFLPPLHFKAVLLSTP